MRHILVDGYNVIRADPRLQSLEQVSLEHARTVLVQTLASAPRLTQDHVVVVFDGQGGTRTHTHAHRRGRINLLFSGQGQTADDVIAAQASALVQRGHVVVVSNDVALRETCRAAGCEVSAAENLLRQVPGRPARPAGADPDDTRETTLSTIKRGNPRRTSKRQRRQRDVQF